MTICVVCKREKSKGETKYAYTGKHLWSSESTTMNPVGPFASTTVSKRAYTDFVKHEVFVCNDCSRKENRLLKLALVPALLLAACSGIAALMMPNTTTGEWLCGASVGLPILGGGVAWVLIDVVFKVDVDEILKDAARKQRMLEESSATGINAFTESEYNDLSKT
jgi:hypothetical protein